jgi:hypothetical protein
MPDNPLHDRLWTQGLAVFAGGRLNQGTKRSQLALIEEPLRDGEETHLRGENGERIRQLYDAMYVGPRHRDV